MGNTYPNHKGNYYYRNHALYHIGTLDRLGMVLCRGSNYWILPGVWVCVAREVDGECLLVGGEMVV